METKTYPELARAWYAHMDGCEACKTAARTWRDSDRCDEGQQAREAMLRHPDMPDNS